MAKYKFPKNSEWNGWETNSRFPLLKQGQNMTWLSFAIFSWVRITSMTSFLYNKYFPVHITSMKSFLYKKYLPYRPTRFNMVRKSFEISHEVKFDKPSHRKVPCILSNSLCFTKYICFE